MLLTAWHAAMALFKVIALMKNAVTVSVCVCVRVCVCVCVSVLLSRRSYRLLFTQLQEIPKELQ